jgi:diguanylate cyclase (GGDEF)-like protein/PAS domain S-box-containing protein
MLQRFKSKSIKHSLIIGIAIIHAILMSIFVFDLVQREKAFLLDESKAATIGITRTLAVNSINGVLSNDLIGLEEIIAAQSLQPNFNFGMILDTKGQILAFHNAQNPTENRTGQYISIDSLGSDNGVVILTDRPEVIDTASPIYVNEEQIGWVRVQNSRQKMADSLQKMTYEGVMYALFAILIGALFAWFIGRQLTRDINQLVNTTQKVRAGERNISLNLNRRDELQTLAENFQSMLSSLNNKESELFTEKERAEVTLKSIGDGVITTNRAGEITYLNPVSEHLTGWSNQRATGQPIPIVFKIYNETTMEPANNPALKSMETGQIIALENHTILINHAGESISIEDSGAPIIDRQGQIIGSVLVFHDATEAKKLRATLTWQATHDSLTGLHNRTAFESHLEELIEEAAHDPDSQHCLLYIDLDQFKVVNDTAGHTAGDELLKQVALCIKKEIRDNDLLARIGGDEFSILLANCHLDTAMVIAEKVRYHVDAYRFIWEDKVFNIGTSIGIAKIEGLTNKATVMSQADIACYLAKDNGRNQVNVYIADDKSVEKNYQQLGWVGKIKSGIEQKQFRLYAQEIVPLQEDQAHKSYEILVRLKKADGDIIFPDAFLPAAERFNLMAGLDIYIVKHAIEWLQNHSEKIERLNINISGQSLQNENFNTRLLTLLNENQAINHKICFEITETTAITHMSSSISFLNSIKSYGCQLALDDFGSGFASFTWLKSLPVDYVKIDGTFVLDVLSDKVDAAMVRALHEVSQEMNIKSIAEFVENQAIADWLQTVGIEYAQGYHFHKPTPIEDVF